MAMREMTDGARYESLCDNAAAWNWRKITTFDMCAVFVSAHGSTDIGLDTRLLRAIKIAIHMNTKCHAAFKAFDQRFPRDVVVAWGELVAAWDKDQSQKNPYEEPTASKLSVSGL